MPVVVVGLNHKTAPVGLLERLAIHDEDMPKALHQLSTYEHVLEGVVLSTCNRIEVYALVSKFHGGVLDMRNFLAEFCHVAPDDFADHLYTYHDEAAVTHLFRVASGIDSMVVGESEILGQVRRAFQIASSEAMVQRVLGSAFRRALKVGKRARTETGIGRNPVSVSTAAVELARRAFANDTLADKSVAVVGAGKMGGLAARALAQTGATDITVVNRTPEKAAELAGLFNARARGLDELLEVVAACDIVICSTTAPGSVLDRDLVEAAMARKGGSARLLIVDIAVPRDVDPSASEVPGVVLRDIDDLRGVVDANLGSRLGEVAKVEALISDELERFLEWERASEMAPTIAAVTLWADEIRGRELARTGRKLRLEDDQRTEIDHLTRRIVAKLLHTPFKRARELGDSKQAHLYLTALRELFELDDEPDE
jgi:glutamyl-tRNA reductase